MAAVMAPEPILDGWCPACRQLSVVRADGSCAWCDSPTGAGNVAPTPTRNANGGIPIAMSEQVLHDAHRLYVAGASMREVAEKLHSKSGYRSVQVFTQALYRFFSYRGWPRRDQRQVTAARNHVHGLRARDATADQERSYRRWLREQRRVRCEARRVRGGRCTRTALEGERYCTAHHPDRVAENAAHLARIREQWAQTHTRCAGTVMHGARKGERCLRRAGVGETCCPAHRGKTTTAKEG